MKKLITQIFPIIYLMVNGCSNAPVDKEYYKNGNILSEKYFVNDSTLVLIDYYKDGNIKSKATKINNNFVGSIKYYFPNGKIRQIDNWINGILEGESIEYYENGNIKKEGEFQNGRPIGDFKYYFPDGNLKIKRSYIIVGDSSYLNEFIFYNKDGDTLKNESNFFTVFLKRDTIYNGENFDFMVHLNAPFIKDSMYVITGKYNDKFILTDSSSLIKWIGNKYKIAASSIPNDTGTHYVRGIIYNFNDSISREQYFEIEYFVKNSPID